MTKINLTGLHRFQKKINNLQKTDIVKVILDELADIAVETLQREHDKIQLRYADSFMGRGNQPTIVKKTSKGNTRTVTARGKSVLFIEYGSGVHFNSPQSKRPSDIKNIGEYGKGQGKNDFWYYSQYGGKSISTQGNPAALGVEKAMQAMQEYLRGRNL